MTKRKTNNSRDDDRSARSRASQHPASLPSWAWTAGSLLLAAALASVWYFEKKPTEAEAQSASQIEGQTTVAAPAMAAMQPDGDKQAATNLAPDFSRPEVNSGKAIKLSAYRGKVVIVDFWATWCGPCRMEIPHFVELQKQYQGKGFTFVGVSLDQQGPGVVKKFISQWNINYPIVMDMEGALAQSYGGIRGIPTTFIIGKKGDIKDTHVGYRPKEVFEEAIKKALAEI